MNEKQQIGRLTMRREGKDWNVYYILPNKVSMLLFLCSMRVNTIANNPKRMRIFMDMVSDTVKYKTGIQPDWEEPKKLMDLMDTMK